MTVLPDETSARIDLAAAFRWAARWDMHESIANHFSVAVSDDGFSSIVAEGARVLKTASSGGFGASDAAVTLAVDEASALRLASASARGTLTLIIRPPSGSVS